MATVKKGMLTGSPEWWKHLRWTKRQFWHQERKAAERDVKARVDEIALINEPSEVDWMADDDEWLYGSDW